MRATTSGPRALLRIFSWVRPSGANGLLRCLNYVGWNRPLLAIPSNVKAKNWWITLRGIHPKSLLFLIVGFGLASSIKVGHVRPAPHVKGSHTITQSPPQPPPHPEPPSLPPSLEPESPKPSVPPSMLESEKSPPQCTAPPPPPLLSDKCALLQSAE